MAAEPMTWERMLATIKEHFANSNGNPNIDYLKRYMQAYTSRRADWEKYNIFDPQRSRYTRNLVDKGNGQFEFVVLCWPEGTRSLIHNHAESHCLMKILQGPIKETMFAWPSKSEMGDEYPEQSMKEREIRCNVYQTDEVAYINDSIGLHRIENPSHADGSVSLNLYIPPITISKVFDDDTARSSIYKMTFDTRDGK